MPANLWVIGGTDTEIGKTRMGIAIGAAFRGFGENIRAIKPIESGVRELTFETEDGALLAQSTGQDSPQSALIRLETPIAPPAAADLEGRELSWPDLLSDVKGHLTQTDFGLVEGAGGILSPLTWEKTTLDLATELDAPLILVVADRLGALNQTRMAMAACASRGIPVTLVVLSAGAREDITTGLNERSLLRCPEFRGSDSPALISVPRLTEKDDGQRYFSAWVKGVVNGV